MLGCPLRRREVKSTTTTLSAADEMDGVTVTGCDESYGIMNVWSTGSGNDTTAIALRMQDDFRPTPEPPMRTHHPRNGSEP